MDRDTKVSMVTFSYDLLRRVKGQRRSKFLTILNVKNNSQHVEHGQVCRSVHGGLFWPTVKGSKVKEGQNSKLFQMAKIIISTCWARTDMQKCSHWSHCSTYRWWVKGQRRSLSTRATEWQWHGSYLSFHSTSFVCFCFACHFSPRKFSKGHHFSPRKFTKGQPFGKNM